MKLELRHLRVICLIADTGSIGRASARLGVPQPSITTQLKRIEKSLGGQLFVRSHTGMVPTEFGEFAIVRCRDILGQFGELLADAKSRSAGVRPLRFGGTPGLVFHSAVEALEKNSAGQPVVARTELDRLKLVTLLSCGELDGITYLEYPGFPTRLPSRVQRIAATVGPGFIMLPSGHRLAGESELKLSDLHDEDWVLPPVSGDGYRSYLRQIFEAAGVSLRVTYEIADAASAVDIISRGKALGLGQSIRRDQQGLVLKPIVGSPISYTQYFAWDETGPLAPYISGTLEQARAEYRQAALDSPTFRHWLELNEIPAECAADPYRMIDQHRIDQIIDQHR